MITRCDFPDPESLAFALAEAVADRLDAALAERGEAGLAVSGGNTPRAFLAALGARTDLDWARVRVTLVDERWVDETSPRSNARMVRETLLQGPAAAARFLPLHVGSPEPDATAIARVEAGLDHLPARFAAVVLGMGLDGHTASYFPGGDTLEEALASPGPLVALKAPDAGEPRITFTLPRLLETDALFLHVEGDDKAAVLAEALAPGPVAAMPVRAVLRAGRPLTIYWCP